MEIITRAEAKARGLTRYFTGKPCKHGHVAERFVASYICSECNRITLKTAYDIDPKKHTQNPRQRESSLKWRRANLEKARAANRLWAKANPDVKRRNKQKQRALKKNSATHPYTAADLQALKASQGNRCPHTGIHFDDLPKTGHPSTRVPHVDHIVPLSKGGGDVLSNLQYLSPQANLAKHNKFERYVWDGTEKLGVVYGHDTKQLDAAERKLRRDHARRERRDKHGEILWALPGPC